MGLLFWGVDLQPCKTMTDTLAPVECANWGVTSLEFYPRPEWCPFGLVEWSGPSGGDWWPCHWNFGPENFGPWTNFFTENFGPLDQF